MFLRRKAIASESDEDLVQLLREGHRSALGHLWDRYAHLLYSVGMKYLKDPERSKDEVAELFAGLSGLVKKHEVKTFRPWLHTVMRNRCLQALRNAKPSVAIPDELMHAQTTDAYDDAVLHEATLQQLEQAIGELNAEQQLCIRTFHLERLSYQQVAERTGLSTDQIRSHLQNGRRNLRLILTRARNAGSQHHAHGNA
ncbi:MAG: sigma-70 family RNA polymerase sigma factor [Flavobacteriales bacterium]|nr:sigma-70 family RNA polymerase sigma factor [Flavobacteriales bacterium]